MPKIELEILAEDILLDNYMDAYKCPITKALHRAGYSDAIDSGTIELNGYDLINYNNKSYCELIDKLFGMYNSINSKYGIFRSARGVMNPIPVESFKHTLEY